MKCVRDMKWDLRPMSSRRIFWIIKVATCKHNVKVLEGLGYYDKLIHKQWTVFESSDPLSIIRRHSGIISVWSRKDMTSESSICINECGYRALSWESAARTNLNKSTDDAKTCKTKVLILTIHAHSVQKRIEEKAQMSYMHSFRHEHSKLAMG